MAGSDGSYSCNEALPWYEMLFAYDLDRFMGGRQVVTAYSPSPLYSAMALDQRRNHLCAA